MVFPSLQRMEETYLSSLFSPEYSSVLGTTTAVLGVVALLAAAHPANPVLRVLAPEGCGKKLQDKPPLLAPAGLANAVEKEWKARVG
jgi:hypothetical protein